jgi:hypothetical protein
MMQQVQQMQAEMAKAQEELANERVEASVGGGMVTVTASGAGDIVGIKISPEAIATAALIGLAGGFAATTSTYSHDTDDTCGFSDVTDVSAGPDPLLGPLADNGGPTDTHALFPDSPAIGRGGSCGTVDQRAFDRDLQRRVVVPLHRGGREGRDLALPRYCGMSEVNQRSHLRASPVYRPVVAPPSSTLTGRRLGELTRLRAAGVMLTNSCGGTTARG